MSKERGWTNVSFTPADGKKVPFGDVLVNVVGTDEEFDPRLHWDPSLWIRSSSVAAIPVFDKGVRGTFEGTYSESGVIYSVVNTKVYDSKAGDLILEGASRDGTTNPLSFSRP